MLRRTTTFRAPLPGVVPTIWVAGLNWTSHAAEVNLPKPEKPIFTMKTTSSLLYPPSYRFKNDFEANQLFCGSMGNKIKIPHSLQAPADADYEGELAIVIGQRCKNLTVQNVIDYYDTVVSGYTCALDITARRWQGRKGGGQWCVAKSFDTFLPLGPEVVPVPLSELPNLSLTTKLNGATVQHAKFSEFIFDVPTIISFLSTITTLHPGTVILTGTPAGVGFARKAKVKQIGRPVDGGEVQAIEKIVPDPYYLKHGDALEVSIDKVGNLKCLVEYQGREGEPRLPI